MKSRDRRRIKIPREAEEASHLMQHYTADRSVALILQPDSAEPESASAVCIEIGGHYLLATARHNLEPFHDDDDVLLLPRGVRFHAGLPFLRRSHPRADPVEADVGWIEVDRDQAAREGLKALRLEQLSCGRRFTRKTVYYIQGYPSLEVEIADERAFDPLSICLLLVNVESGEEGKGVAVEYPPQSPEDAGLELVHPGGFSGGGIWTCESLKVWPHMNVDAAKVVALISRFDRAKNRLQGIDIEYWLRLVVRDFPHLRQTIEPHLLEPADGLQRAAQDSGL